MKNRTYICIDLKSFYASVECRERKLDPLNTNLLVADVSRTEKTICLAVSPSLKAYGIPGRARLFEAVQKVKEVNKVRKSKAPKHYFTGKSYFDDELKKNPSLELDYIIAPPQMKKYMKYSTDIYNIYLKYLAPEDVYVYSIDEVFADVTDYLNTYNMSAKELTSKIIKDVYKTTGITATAGIGTNMFLCKIAMDIVAKHTEPDEYGVRMAELDEMSYRKILWNHKPLTDFWRVGKGYAKKLEANGLYTMGDVSRCSLENEDKLYKMFGINAELLIDHAWGYEPCTIKDVKSYKPSAKSLSTGQVLHCPYNYEKTRLIVREMTDLLALDLVEKKLVTDQLTLTIGYDIDNLANEDAQNYDGEVTVDFYGRRIPKHAHGTVNLKYKTSSTKIIMNAVMDLYAKIVNPKLTVRRININANNLVDEDKAKDIPVFEQVDLFTDYDKVKEQRELEKMAIEKEKRVQKAMIEIKHKYGKNAILKGMNLEEGGTTIERNGQVGGHKG